MQSQSGSAVRNPWCGSQLQPLLKDPLEGRLLAGCNLKSASRTAAFQIVTVEFRLTALETQATQDSCAS